jgi:hypothetical protein
MVREHEASGFVSPGTSHARKTEAYRGNAPRFIIYQATERSRPRVSPSRARAAVRQHPGSKPPHPGLFCFRLKLYANT